MEDGGMCHTFKQSTWGARGRRASRAPKQVEFRILGGFPSYGGWKKTSKETPVLHHVTNGRWMGIMIYVQYQFDAGIWSMNTPWFLCYFFGFAGREKTRVSDVLLEIHRWSYHLCLLPGSLKPSEFSVGWLHLSCRKPLRCYIWIHMIREDDHSRERVAEVRRLPRSVSPKNRRQSSQSPRGGGKPPKVLFTMGSHSLWMSIRSILYI